ncbi:ATP-binding protein [Streptomyces regalis]|uniref:ATP-binding protein n=1 Tax=Streptomyces regalis TaxID=68262 RepID=UPI00099E1C2C
MSHHPLEELPYAFKVPAALGEVRPARKRVVERARRIGLVMNEQLVGDLELLAGEVIANAIRHTDAPCVVCVRWTGERLRVEVTDVEAIVPIPTSAGPEDEGGRGLFLVDALADAWGAVPDPAGKTTWFELEPRPAQATSLVHVSACPGSRPSRNAVAGCTDPASGVPRSEGTRVALPSRGAQQRHQAA